MPNDPLAQYSIPGTTVTVYSNRLVISTGVWPAKKEELITFRNIATIEKPTLLNCLDIKTNDGKKHRVTVPPQNLKALKDLIESNL